jgi:hypothetical protein
MEDLMVEMWLRPNRRAIAAASCIPVAMLLLGLLWAWHATQAAERPWPYVLSGILVALGGLLITILAFQWRQPRIGYRDGKILFYLQSGTPIATPIDAVEAFFVGQGPAMIGARGGRELETVNLVARISCQADQWQHVDVNPRLGHWCDGYVTIRGTWCEPLTNERVLQLNQCLHDARRESVEKAANKLAKR